MPMSRARSFAVVLALAGAGGTLAVGLTLPVAPEPVARLWTLSVGGDYQGRSGVRLQKGTWDCGVAVLAMIFEEHHRPSALEAVRGRVLDRGEGLSLLEMQSVAREHGLAAAGWRLDFPGLARAPLPAVAHFDNHYVVVDRIEPDGTVHVRDPAIGRVALPKTSFLALWTGNVLLFAPGPALGPSRK